ncbi:hypothetical protein NIT7321_00082 [Phaeobacter italicus]|jgi:uncharacterized Zn-finger protein|uniref:Uncharacterized protein n=1 Tax=Phaeobacter italicus TaxID=481446 RepID=A0A0H5CXC7_9RHOB|nr:hypothetical protein [Phaeobacter italicus]CRL09253.1 hypothetical protein NIT7321_00082 [Phaeobacter italicus]
MTELGPDQQPSRNPEKRSHETKLRMKDHIEILSVQLDEQKCELENRRSYPPQGYRYMVKGNSAGDSKHTILVSQNDRRIEELQGLIDQEEAIIDDLKAILERAE